MRISFDLSKTFEQMAKTAIATEKARIKN